MPQEFYRFLVSCEFVDAAAMTVLMEGCHAHADVDVFPLWLQDTDLEISDIKTRFPHLLKLEETWDAIFPTRESLEVFTEILATIEFKAPDFIRFASLDNGLLPEATLILNLSQFHRHVFHELKEE